MEFPMASVLSAQLEWAQDRALAFQRLSGQNHVGERVRTPDESVALAESTVSDLRTEGDGYVSQVEAAADAVLAAAEQVEEWAAVLHDDRNWLESLPDSLPGELSALVQELLASTRERDGKVVAAQASIEQVAAEVFQRALRLFQAYHSFASGVRAANREARAIWLTSRGRTRLRAWGGVAAELDTLIGRLREVIRLMVVSLPELDLTVPDRLHADIWTFRIPPLAYLRAMWNLWWSAVRHPLSETTIDLSTGRVLYRT
jgi:hypothetical protein